MNAVILYKLLLLLVVVVCLVFMVDDDFPFIGPYGSGHECGLETK